MSSCEPLLFLTLPDERNALSCFSPSRVVLSSICATAWQNLLRSFSDYFCTFTFTTQSCVFGGGGRAQEVKMGCGDVGVRH